MSRRMPQEAPKVEVSAATRAEFTQAVWDRFQHNLDKKQARAEWQVQLEQAALREQGSEDRNKNKDKKHKKSKHKKHSKKDKKEKHHKKHKHSKHKRHRNDSSTSSDSSSSTSSSSSDSGDDSSRRKRQKSAAHDTGAADKRILQRGSEHGYEDSRGRYESAAGYSRGREPGRSRSRSPVRRRDDSRSRSRDRARGRPSRSHSPERQYRNGGHRD